MAALALSRRVQATGTEHEPTSAALAFGFSVSCAQTCGGPDGIVVGHAIVICEQRRRYSFNGAVAHELGHRAIDAHTGKSHSEDDADAVAALVFPASMEPPKY